MRKWTVQPHRVGKTDFKRWWWWWWRLFRYKLVRNPTYCYSCYSHVTQAPCSWLFQRWHSPSSLPIRFSSDVYWMGMEPTTLWLWVQNTHQCTTVLPYLTVPALVLSFQLADQVLVRRVLNGNGTHNPLIMGPEHTPMHHSAPIPDCSSAGTLLPACRSGSRPTCTEWEWNP